MLSDHDIQFIDRGYGKNYVRLLRVKRDGDWHEMKEIEVNTTLKLSDCRDYQHGDNQQIIATDSQKNTVYILAKQNGIKYIEEFAMELCDHFLRKYPQVMSAKIYIQESSWQRVKQGNKEHCHAFIHSGEFSRFCQVTQMKHELPQVSAGLKDMKLLKTTKSAFINFVQDEYRSLPDMADRIFCSVVAASWKYHSLTGLDYDKAWDAVKNSIVEIFAGPPDVGIYSPSVQKTVYDASKLALGRVPQISEIEMEFPNVHAYEFDLSKYPAFGFTKNEEIFQPTDKPSGNIKASFKRRVLPQSKL